MSQQAKVELHNAYVWDCDNCGQENFCRAVTMELTNEQRQEMYDELGLSDESREELGRDLVTSPDTVTCAHCGTEVETEDFS